MHHRKKVPYMLIIGEQELENGTLAVRERKGLQTAGVSRQDFYKAMLLEINNKVIKKD